MGNLMKYFKIFIAKLKAEHIVLVLVIFIMIAAPVVSFLGIHHIEADVAKENNKGLAETERAKVTSDVATQMARQTELCVTAIDRVRTFAETIYLRSTVYDVTVTSPIAVGSVGRNRPTSTPRSKPQIAKPSKGLTGSEWTTTVSPAASFGTRPTPQMRLGA